MEKFEDIVLKKFKDSQVKLELLELTLGSKKNTIENCYDSFYARKLVMKLYKESYLLFAKKIKGWSKIYTNSSQVLGKSLSDNRGGCLLNAKTNKKGEGEEWWKKEKKCI